MTFTLFLYILNTAVWFAYFYVTKTLNVLTFLIAMCPMWFGIMLESVSEKKDKNKERGDKNDDI